MSAQLLQQNRDVELRGGRKRLSVGIACRIRGRIPRTDYPMSEQKWIMPCFARDLGAGLRNVGRQSATLIS